MCIGLFSVFIGGKAFKNSIYYYLNDLNWGLSKNISLKKLGKIGIGNSSPLAAGLYTKKRT